MNELIISDLNVIFVQVSLQLKKHVSNKKSFSDLTKSTKFLFAVAKELKFALDTFKV